MAQTVAEFHQRLDRQYSTLLDDHDLVKRRGHITKVIGLVFESHGPEVAVGEQCLIHGRDRTISAEVVGFRDDRVLLMPLERATGIGPGSEVITTGEPFWVPVGPELMGRVVDGFGRPVNPYGYVYENQRPRNVAPSVGTTR